MLKDIYAYAHTVRTDEGTKVMLTLRSLDNTIDCGSRFKYMEPEIKFSYNALVEALNKAIDEEARQTGKEFVTNERNVSVQQEELDFDKIVNEFISLTRAIPETKINYYGPRIVEITDKYLGKGKKVTTATRDQVEQVALCLFDLKELLSNE